MTTEHALALSEETRKRISAIADRHEQQLLEEALRESPGDFEILARLGELYPRLGRPEDGLTIDRTLVGMAPADPIVRYNFACSLALTGDIAAAFQALREAIRLGYTDLAHLLRDEDLAALRQEPLFNEVLRLLERLARGKRGEKRGE